MLTIILHVNEKLLQDSVTLVCSAVLAAADRSDFGIMKHHSVLTEGLTMPPSMRSSLAQSLGPATIIMNLVHADVSIIQYKPFDCDCNWEALDTCQNAAHVVFL